jgi:hypothetical protein
LLEGRRRSAICLPEGGSIGDRLIVPDVPQVKAAIGPMCFEGAVKRIAPSQWRKHNPG